MQIMLFTNNVITKPFVPTAALLISRRYLKSLMTGCMEKITDMKKQSWPTKLLFPSTFLFKPYTQKANFVSYSYYTLMQVREKLNMYVLIYHLKISSFPSSRPQICDRLSSPLQETFNAKQTLTVRTAKDSGWQMPSLACPISDLWDMRCICFCLKCSYKCSAFF